MNVSKKQSTCAYLEYANEKEKAYMAAARKPPVATATSVVVDDRAARIAQKRDFVNKQAVEQGMTTANRPLVTTLAQRHDMFGKPVPTGSILLDFLLGGGWPRGCSTKLWGAEGCGKSNLAMAAAAGVIKNNGYVLWMQAEDGDPWEMAGTYGIPKDHPNFLVFYCQGSGEQAFSGLKGFLMDGRVPSMLLDLVVVDSLAGLEPKDLIDYDTKKNAAGKTKGAEGSVNPGRVAAMYASIFRYLHSTKALGTAAMLMISQARVDIGSYGSPEKSVGGRATDHAARLVIKMKRASGEGMIKVSKTTGEQIGHTNELTFTKDGYRHRLQGRKASFIAYYKKGIDNPTSYFDLLQLTGALIKASSVRYETSEAFRALIEGDSSQFVSFTGAPKAKEALQNVNYLRAAKAYLEDYINNGRGDISEADTEEGLIEGEDGALFGAEPETSSHLEGPGSGGASASPHTASAPSAEEPESEELSILDEDLSDLEIEA